MGSCTLEQLSKEWPIEEEELNPALGKARERCWIDIRRVDGRALVTAVAGVGVAPDESLLKKLEQGPLVLDSLSREERAALQRLMRRPGFIEQAVRREVQYSIKESGRLLLSRMKPERWVDSITPQLIVSGKWRRYKLRPIDVTIPGPTVHPARIHPLNEVLEEVREIFLSMGFEEIEGSYIQSCFWNFDALFVPQDHPAREMQDTFYLKDLRSRGLARAELVSRVKHTHIDGWETGSKGWGGVWSEEEARRLVLRTHTTAVTIRYLAEVKPREARVFSVDRVFRNEKVTWRSNIEFNQIEGIAVGPGLSLRDLIGLLSEFYRRLGLKEIKFWPTYFPYTEPSLQVMVKYEGKWLEMGGSGIFRPEVTLPLGVRNPVLAWGLGDRLAMLKLGVKDIRQFYEADLGWLRGGG